MYDPKRLTSMAISILIIKAGQMPVKGKGSRKEVQGTRFKVKGPRGKGKGER